MNSIRLFGTRAQRTLVASLLLLLALALIALPAGAARPNQPGSTTTLVAGGSVPGEACVFTATYTWQNFGGNNLAATINLRYGDPPGNQIAAATTGPFAGKGGTFSIEFRLTGDPPYTTNRDIRAYGSLFKPGKGPVSGTGSQSDPISTPCRLDSEPLP